MKNRVIVIGSSHHNTLGMIRCLGKVDIYADLILIGCKSSYIAKSRYINRVYFIDQTDDVLTILFRYYNSDGDKSIIISCTDPVACLLDSNYEVLKNNFIFFNCGGGGKLTQYMDKQTQTELAKEVGIKVPVSYIYKDKIDKILFPCIIKPLKSINGGKKIKVCYSEKDLKDNIILFRQDEEIIIQQLINKKYEIVLLGLSVNGEIIIPGYIQKYRDNDGGTLYSGLKSISSMDRSMISKSKNLIRKMNYEGLFGIEMIYDGNDYYFIEVNLRNDATTYSLAVGGVNLPELFIKGKIQNHRVTDDLKVNELNSIVEFNDLKHRKSNNISLVQWIKQFLGAKCKYYFNLKDPLPFVFAPFKR